MRSASIFHERRRRAWTIAAAAGVALALATTATALAQTFHTQTDLVVLQVTVVDHERRYVRDLHQEDFGVFEEGVLQDVSLFAADRAPLDLMLLLDTSGSMVARLPIVRQAAIDFVRALGPGDRAAVVFFNSTVRIAHPLDGDPAKIEEAIQRATPSGSTALYEALYIAQRELTRARGNSQEVRRQAIVVLTDGADNVSRVTFDDVLADARSGSLTIYAIVPPETVVPSPGLLEERPPLPMYDLRTLVEQTGGRLFTPARLLDLGGVYGEIAEELNQQYWLAYAPKRPARGFRRLGVRILTQPTLRARTRSGYEMRSTPRPRAATPQ